MHNYKILINNFICIHYPLHKYLKLVSAKFLLPMISLKWTLHNTRYVLYAGLVPISVPKLKNPERQAIGLLWDFGYGVVVYRCTLPYSILGLCSDRIKFI